MKNIFTLNQCNGTVSMQELRKKYINELGNKTIEHIIKSEMSLTEKEKILSTVKNNMSSDEKIIVHGLTPLNKLLYYGDKIPRTIFKDKIGVL